MNAERVTRRFVTFLAVSATLIGVVVACAGLAVGTFFERYVLATEESETAEIAQHHARQHLTAQSFALPVPATEAARITHFMDGLPGVFRIKVYGPSGHITLANDERLIGQRFEDNDSLRRALGGQVVTAMKEPQHHRENVYERSRRYVAETYVPIRLTAAGPVAGVVETYKDMTALKAGVAGTQRRVWQWAGGTGLALYVALAAVVWTALDRERRALRRLAEQHRDLAETHERVAAIVAAITDEMVILDPAMRVVWTNPAAAGRPIGSLCFGGTGVSSEACENCPAIRTLASRGVERGVRAYHSAGGRTRYVDLVTVPLRDAAGGVVQVLEVARDVTELVEMEVRLKEANQALLDAQSKLVETERLAAIGELVVGLHHAVLNPLTGVLGVLEVLKGETPASDRTRLVAEAAAEIRKVEQLIRGLATPRATTPTCYVGETRMLDVGAATAAPRPAPKDGA